MHLYDLFIGVVLLAEELYQKIELKQCLCLKLSWKLWYFTLEYECDKAQLEGA